MQYNYWWYKCSKYQVEISSALVLFECDHETLNFVNANICRRIVIFLISAFDYFVLEERYI